MFWQIDTLGFLFQPIQLFDIRATKANTPVNGQQSEG